MYVLKNMIKNKRFIFKKLQIWQRTGDRNKVLFLSFRSQRRIV